MGKVMKEILFSVTKKDFVIEPYKGSGKGGQHRNKTMSCCRIKHPESKAVAQACEERDYHRNQKVAFRRLIKTPKFEIWRQRKAYELRHSQTAEEKLEHVMQPKNIKVEIKVDGKWVEETKE